MKKTPLHRKTGLTAAKKAYKKVKKESVASWKKKCDQVVSQWVRRSAADAQGFVECYTCGKRAQWKIMQCGHFVSRNNSATRFDEKNLRPQDAGCNIWGRGRYDVYADKLMDELGVEEFRALLARGRSIHQFTVQELKDIHADYSHRLSLLDA